jgi:hypothetical protein
MCADEDCRNLFLRHDVAGGAWLSNAASTNYMAVCRLYCWCTTYALIMQQVVVAKGCLATSTMSGHGLSVATAGVARSFTVTVRDSFGNLRPTGTDFPLSSSITSDNLPGYVVNMVQPTANRFCLSVSCHVPWASLTVAAACIRLVTQCIFPPWPPGPSSCCEFFCVFTFFPSGSLLSWPT